MTLILIFGVRVRIANCDSDPNYFPQETHGFYGWGNRIESFARKSLKNSCKSDG